MDSNSWFISLIVQASGCTICPRMLARSAVLSHSSGPLDADVMFVGEAPGRLGADETTVPFHGDVAGRNFEDFLVTAGLTRERIFITNAVLCNPRDDVGNNSSPSRSEIFNCASFLREQIQLVNPKVVITLGAVALKALETIEQHEIVLRSGVAETHQWFGRILFPLYHPGARALIHRSRATQLADYAKLRKLLNPRTSSTLLAWRVVAARLLAILPYAPTYFGLHKLFYLCEWKWMREHNGERLTDAYFIRQSNGPYCTNLHAKTLARVLCYSLRNDGRVVPSASDAPLLLRYADVATIDPLPPNVESHLDTIAKSYGSLSDARLKTIVYLSSEMRSILRTEKHAGRLLNLPLLRPRNAG